MRLIVLHFHLKLLEDAEKEANNEHDTEEKEETAEKEHEDEDKIESRGCTECNMCRRAADA